MNLALEEAKKAYKLAEVPIGAVLVSAGKVVAAGYNQVEFRQDATCHAEVVCLRAAAVKLGNWRLTGSTLYCTVEPCMMCAGAILLSRVETIVWGTKDVRHGANGSLLDVFEIKHPTHTVNIRQNVLQEACSQILKSFFKEQRALKRVR